MINKTLAILAIVFCSFTTPAALLAQESGDKKLSFDSGGVPIRYIVEGKADGEPVVLIHGFTASIERQWPAVIDDLKKDYKVIALDCRGHGRSGKPHDPKKYGIEMINDVVRLLDHLKIDKAHIVGYSMGAGIALVFTVNHPGRVRTLTVGGAGVPDTDREKMLLELAQSLEMGKGLGPLIKALTPKDRPALSDAQMAIINATLLSFNDTKALAAALRGAAGNKEVHPTAKQIQEIRVPVLALIGADDPLRPGVDELKRLLPKTREMVIAKADHIGAFQRTEFVNGLRQFLDEHRRLAKR